MGKYGVNVPKGVAVSSLDEVRKAIQGVFPNENEVIVCNSGIGVFLYYTFNKRITCFWCLTELRK